MGKIRIGIKLGNDVVKVQEVWIVRVEWKGEDEKGGKLDNYSRNNVCKQEIIIQEYGLCPYAYYNKIRIDEYPRI